MKALVKEGQVVRTFRESTLSLDGVFYTDVNLLSKQEQEALGIYPVQVVQVDAPENYMECGSSFEFQCGVVYEMPALYVKE
jgi:hypothetical protein